MLDRESLRRAAAARRAEAPAPEPQAPSWRCGHCGRDFTAEHFFMRHRCKERERAEELMNGRMKLKMRQNDNPLSVRNTRRELAVIKTVINEKRSGR